MSIRWRLSILLIQVIVLCYFTYLVTGKIYSNEIWFYAGLLAVVINPQLLEPYYPKPQDIVANSIIFVILYISSPKIITIWGWHILATFVLISFVSALISIILGANKSKSKYIGFASAARRVSQKSTARVIYSSVFILSCKEYYPSYNSDFWYLLTSWVIIIFIGTINWQFIFSIAVKKGTLTKIEGMVGPSTLLLSAHNLPSAGTRVKLVDKSHNFYGTVLNRIKRLEDTWAQIHIADQQECEILISKSIIEVDTTSEKENSIIGSVDVGSSDRILKFKSIRTLEIGEVVGVPLADLKKHVVYQLSSAQVEKKDVKGGSHLIVNATANQLGIFKEKSLEFVSHRWVPPPGASVVCSGFYEDINTDNIQPGNLLLGHVIGTKIPIFLNCDYAAGGHLAILG